MAGTTIEDMMKNVAAEHEARMRQPEWIRRNERHRLADLLERDGDQITQFIKEPADLMRMLVYLLRLDAPSYFDGTGN